jgi:hypothetical protein
VICGLYLPEFISSYISFAKVDLLIKNYLTDVGLWIVRLRVLVDSPRYQRFGERTASIFRAEDGGSIFLWKVVAYMQAHVVLVSKTPTSISPP